MVIKCALNTRAKRTTVLALTIAACATLAFTAMADFVVGALSDERVGVSRDASTASFIFAPLTDSRVGINAELLASAVEYFPSSPRLHARLAEAEMMAGGEDLSRAELHALRAVKLSPRDYRFRLLLAFIKEAQGDAAASESSLRAALALAPNNSEVHWYLASALLANGKFAESLPEFSAASASDGSFLADALYQVWTASGGDLNAAQFVAGDSPRARLRLAQFLLDQSRPTEAADIFGRVDPGARLLSPKSARFLSALIDLGHVDLARGLWVDLVSGGGRDRPVLWNGGYESRISKSFDHFDWKLGRSDYAWATVDSRVARTGVRSLRIDFTGLDTTRLDGEVNQMIVARPGTRYRLECYVKTEGLVTPGGPRVVVTDAASTWLAASDPIPPGSNDWQRLTFDFVTPRGASAGAAALHVSVKRKPKYVYDEPTRGTVWFDDFSLTEVQGQR